MTFQKKACQKESHGMHFHIFLADFGLSDAFKEFGYSQGGRPYMAPEQFDSSGIDPKYASAFDIFALSVIACECILDGRHPIGQITRNVWPWHKEGGGSRKWGEKKVWQEWASREAKTLPESADRFPPRIHDLLIAGLAVDPRHRPSMREFEKTLWNALGAIDPKTQDGLRMQVEYIESLSPGVEPWPHMDERLAELRAFYDSMSCTP